MPRPVRELLMITGTESNNVGVPTAALTLLIVTSDYVIGPQVAGDSPQTNHNHPFKTKIASYHSNWISINTRLER